MDLKEEGILGSAIHGHWYYVSKGKALRHYLDGLRVAELLDVGAGSGIFSRQLLNHGVADSAICVDPFYTEEKSELQNGRPIRFVRQIDAVPQRLILMMDVLEHVADDLALLKLYADRMPSGGHILVTVPAFQFLWSGHDVFLEHYRRYTAATVDDLVKAAGLDIVKTRYFFGLLFPAVALIRKIKSLLPQQQGEKAHSELRRYPPWLNNMLIRIHDLERTTVFDANILAGLSVFCLCKKR